MSYNLSLQSPYTFLPNCPCPFFQHTCANHLLLYAYQPKAISQLVTSTKSSSFTAQFSQTENNPPDTCLKIFYLLCAVKASWKSTQATFLPDTPNSSHNVFFNANTCTNHITKIAEFDQYFQRFVTYNYRCCWLSFKWSNACNRPQAILLATASLMYPIFAENTDIHTHMHACIA